MLDDMTNPDNMRPSLGERIKEETERNIKGTPDLNRTVQPCDDAEFREACAYLGKDILSQEKLLENLAQLRSDYLKLKDIFSPDSDHALAIFPTSDMGNPLSSDDIQNHRYLHRLAVDKDTGLTSNFSWRPGQYFGLLPEKLQAMCRLSVEYTDENSTINNADFSRLYNSYIDTFNNLREYLGLEKLNDVPRYSGEAAA